MDDENRDVDTLDSQGEEQDALIPEVEAEAELAKADELVSNYQIRLKKAEAMKLKAQAEKAEREARDIKTPSAVEKEAPRPSETMSIKDIRALQDVAEEDIDEVIEFSQFKKISISEAKNHPAVQSLLRTKEEERKTAQATNSGGSRRAVSKNTGEAILERANRGELPEDDDGIQKLAEARLAAKIAAADKKRNG